ncbi:MAG TPA: S53 family peptidase [Caulobacteraceae bacterium]|jgi:subtilase family serine protease|nr:S53 family peptidase [Caulobacteraceae bacterium]
MTVKFERLLSTAVTAAALVLGGASVAAAQGFTPAASPHVQQSGHVFHVAVCGAAPQGYARCHAHVVTDNRGTPIAQIFSRTGVTRNTTPSGYGPSDLHSAYGVTTSGSASTIVAVVDAYGYANAETDLATYRAQYGLPACTTANGCFKKVNEYGQTSSYPRNNVGWEQETALDLDMVSAMCPNCHIVLVQATTSSFGDLAQAEMTAASLGAHAISNSYGGGESGSQSYESAYNHPGVAVTVSSGDSGYGTQFPASSPHVTAVGGTHLVRSSTSRGWTETTWADAGSGCSTIYAKPSWQHDTLCSKRMEADVSAVADPNTGVAVYGPTGSFGSGWMVFGGTSVAAPLVAGVYGVNGGSVNYGSNPYGATTALNDVTSGSNGSCGGTYFCTAGAGYDGPTGLGTPKGPTAF